MFVYSNGLSFSCIKNYIDSLFFYIYIYLTLYYILCTICYTVFGVLFCIRIYIYINEAKEWRWIRLGSYKSAGTGSPGTNTQAGDVYTDDITNSYMAQDASGNWVQINN